MANIRVYAQPSRLFRYRPLRDENIADELRAIEQGYVFCPTYDELNDPMEGAHRESALFRESRAYDRNIGKVRSTLSTLGVASFSETHDNEPMWAHYASNFAGMCIAYNFRRLLSNLPDHCDFVRMTYGEDPPLLLRNAHSATDRAKLALSAKTIRWAAEREWRLIAPSRGPVAYGVSNCVAEVYLGSRVRPTHRSQVVEAMRRLGVTVKVMTIDRYELTFRRYRAPLRRARPG